MNLVVGNRRKEVNSCTEDIPPLTSVRPALATCCFYKKNPKKLHNYASFLPFVNKVRISAPSPALLHLQSVLQSLTSRWRHHRGGKVKERELKKVRGGFQQDGDE